MKHFAILLFAFSLEAVAAAQRADRTITWQPWQEWAEFRVRTGDRYLGEECWEHYLAFGLYRPSTKKIKLSMIYLGTELVSDVEIAPGKRYAIVKVTNSKMTAHKGRWSWTARRGNSLGSRNLPTSKNPDSRLSLLDPAGLGKLPNQSDSRAHARLLAGPKLIAPNPSRKPPASTVCCSDAHLGTPTCFEGDLSA